MGLKNVVCPAMLVVLELLACFEIYARAVARYNLPVGGQGLLLTGLTLIFTFCAIAHAVLAGNAIKTQLEDE